MVSSGLSEKWKYLSAINIKPECLIAGRNPHPHQLPNRLLTNGLMYEASRHMKWTTLTGMLKTWMGERLPEKYNNKKLQSVVEKIVKERLKIMKKKKSVQSESELSEFLGKPFLSNMPWSNQSADSSKESVPSCIELVEQLEHEVEECKEGKTRHIEEMKNIKRNTKNSKLREHRKNTLIDRQKSIIRSQTKNIDQLRRISEKHKRQQQQRRLIHNKGRKMKNTSSKTTQCPLSWGAMCFKDGNDMSEAEDHGQERRVYFKAGHKYQPNLIACVLKLLDHHVGYKHVSPVIRAVLTLVDMEADELPCPSTIENMAKLKLPLAQLNLAQTTSSSSLTLYTDETSKRGVQYETFVTTNEGKEPKILGIKEIPDKSADTILKTLQDIINDLDDLSVKSDIGRKILQNIKNTMSDRAATEKLFQQHLYSYRVNVLKEIIPDWDNLTDSERSRFGQMHNFFCGLHLLSNAADKVDASFKTIECKHEEMLSDDNAVNKKNAICYGKSSETVNFVRAACKAFAPGGDEKNGCFGWISVFLKGKGETNKLTPFKGNRFNIVFHNGGAIYHLRHVLTEFLQNCYGTPNGLLISVLNGLKSPMTMACCRVLGIISKYITTPLWNKIESAESILHMSQIYADVVHNLESADAALLLRGELSIIPGVDIPKTNVVLSLIKSQDYDDLATTALSIVLEDLSCLFKRLLADQLHGGNNCDKTLEEFPECSSALSHNKLPESVFGQLDYEKRSKPSSTIYTIEGTIMYNFNKVQHWLDSLGDEQKHNIIIDASTLRTTTVKQYRDRLIGVQTAKLENLRKKQEAREAKRIKRLGKSTDLTNNIIFHGLWQTVEDVDQRLKTYRLKKDSFEALKIQLNFRKTVLGQKADSKLFSMSLNKRKLTLQELVDNLKELIRRAHSNVQHECSPWVNKTISQNFEEDGQIVTYEGRVISQVPGFSQWYNVVYTNEPDTVYTCNTLQEDLDNGDLVLHD